MNLFACVNFLYSKHKLKSDVLKCSSTLILHVNYYIAYSLDKKSFFLKHVYSGHVHLIACLALCMKN